MKTEILKNRSIVLKEEVSKIKLEIELLLSKLENTCNEIVLIERQLENLNEQHNQ